MLVVGRPAPRCRFGDRIIVASSGLERSDELVDFATNVAARLNGSLTYLHAIHAESSRQPARIAAQVGCVTRALGERASVRIEPERARDLIVRTAAEEQCSLIIVSSRRVGGIRALGSVSERVVHDSPCSVLVVRPEDLHYEAPLASAPAAQ